MPDYAPPSEKSDVSVSEFVLSLNQYEQALGEIARGCDFDATREKVGVKVRDETFRK